MAKKNYVLIKNKYRNNYSLYYDLNEKIFVERAETTPVSIYILSVLAMVVTRSVENKQITVPFFYSTVIAVAIGGLLGYLFQIIDQYFKCSSKSFKTIDNSINNLPSYLSEGRTLLSTQMKFVLAVFILFIIICVSFYSNKTAINFLGVVTGAFLIVSLLNFASPLNKRKIFNSITQQLEKQSSQKL